MTCFRSPSCDSSKNSDPFISGSMFLYFADIKHDDSFASRILLLILNNAILSVEQQAVHTVIF